MYFKWIFSHKLLEPPFQRNRNPNYMKLFKFNKKKKKMISEYKDDY